MPAKTIGDLTPASSVLGSMLFEIEIPGVESQKATGTQLASFLVPQLGFTWLGVYSGATAYLVNQVVLHQNSAWVSLQATTGNTPPTLPTTSDAYWQLMAKQGETGTAATIAVGTVTTVSPATPADVTNIGTSGAAIFDFDIPQGAAATIAVGDVDDVAFGQPATVTNVGTSGAAIFDFEIPGGEPGTDGIMASVVAGTGIDVDATDPANPVVAIESGVYRSGGTDVAIADGGTGASTAADAFTALKQAASETATGVVELATDAETQTGTDTARAITPANLTAKEATTANYRANTADRILTTDQVWASSAEVTLTDAATIAVDFSTFINGVVTLGGNRTLGNPTNEKVGQQGVIRIVQDGAGSRTLAYGSDWEFAGGAAPVLSTAIAAQDLLFYHIIAADRVFASLVKAIA